MTTKSMMYLCVLVFVAAPCEIILLTLKLTGAIDDLSWLWVTSPVWSGIAFYAIGIVSGGFRDAIES